MVRRAAAPAGACRCCKSEPRGCATAATHLRLPSSHLCLQLRAQAGVEPPRRGQRGGHQRAARGRRQLAHRLPPHALLGGRLEQWQHALVHRPGEGSQRGGHCGGGQGRAAVGYTGRRWKKERCRLGGWKPPRRGSCGAGEVRLRLGVRCESTNLRAGSAVTSVDVYSRTAHRRGWGGSTHQRPGAAPAAPAARWPAGRC